LYDVDVSNFKVNKLCVWYIVHSSLYYTYYRPVISDSTFDNICKELLNQINNGATIPGKLKEFIDKESLEAGTGYNINFNLLPNRMKSVISTINSGRDFCGDKINLKDWLK